VAVFFIDTDTGQVATQRQLIEAGVAAADGQVPRPWHRIQGSNDATTMWYAVMRKQERGIFIGSLVFRHSPHHALLLERGWEEVPVEQMRAQAIAGRVVGDPSEGFPQSM
jgi:hypothetical protein